MSHRVNTFMAWPKIGQFHNVAERVANPNSTTEMLDYRGKIKLNGVQVAVNLHKGQVKVQHRTKIVSLSEDGTGFSSFVFSEHRLPYFKALTKKMPDYVDRRMPIIFYGEWCGASLGIGKVSAITYLPTRMFVVFAAMINDTRVIVEPKELEAMLNYYDPYAPSDIHVLPWHTDMVRLSFKETALLQSQLDWINQHVAVVDACDPWVYSLFGIPGPGEGLVWYPLNKKKTEGSKAPADVGKPGVSLKTVRTYAFKAKGPTHRGTNVELGALARTPRVKNAQAFAKMFCTENRFLQGIQEACGGQYQTHNSYMLQEWVLNDVMTEGAVELQLADLDKLTVTNLVLKATDEWHTKAILRHNFFNSADYKTLGSKAAEPAAIAPVVKEKKKKKSSQSPERPSASHYPPSASIRGVAQMASEHFEDETHRDASFYQEQTAAVPALPENDKPYQDLDEKERARIEREQAELNARQDALAAFHAKQSALKKEYEENAIATPDASPQEKAIAEFIGKHITTSVLLLGVAEVCQGKFESALSDALLQWIVERVLTGEAAQEVEENALLDQGVVSAAVLKTTDAWYEKEVSKRGKKRSTTGGEPPAKRARVGAAQSRTVAAAAPHLSPEAAFIAAFVSDSRLLKGVAEVCGGSLVYSAERLGELQKWTMKNVKSEGAKELEREGFDKEKVSVMVLNAVEKWYKAARPRKNRWEHAEER